MTHDEIDLICATFGLVHWYDKLEGNTMRLDGRDVGDFREAWRICAKRAAQDKGVRTKP